MNDERELYEGWINNLTDIEKTYIEHFLIDIWKSHMSHLGQAIKKLDRPESEKILVHDNICEDIARYLSTVSARLRGERTKNED